MIDMVMRRLRQESDDRGFTLIEIVVAILIFSILAAIAIPVYLNQQKAVIEQQLKITLTNASIILKQERAGANGRYPTLLPADVVIPEDISLTYTNSQNREAYCLEATHVGDLENKMFLNGDDKGDSTISEHDCTYDASGPASTVLSGDVNTDNQPLLSWTPVEGTTSYSVENLTTGDSFTVSGSTSWTGEPMETPQSFRVIVNAGGVTSDPSNTVRLNPPDIRPTATPVLTINNVSGSASQRTGTLQWHPVKWADEYLIVNADTNDEMWRGSAYNLDISAAVGKVTRVYLIASNSAGQSPHSNVVELEGPQPTSPNLNISSSSTSSGWQAILTWNDVPGAQSYELYKNGTHISSDAISGLTDSTPWDSGLITYYVVPVTENGRSGDSSNSVSLDTTNYIPGVPVLHSEYYDWSDNTFIVSWNRAYDADRYQVRYRINGGNWSQPYNGREYQSGHIQWSYSHSHTPGATLYVQVRSVSAKGALSDWSDSKSISPMPASPTVHGWSINGFNSSWNGYNQVSVNVTCPTGSTLISKRRNDQTGVMSNYGGETMNLTQAQHTTQIYGHATKVQWQFRCRADANTSVTSNVVNVNTVLQPKPVPAPDSTVQHFPSWVQDTNYEANDMWLSEVSMLNTANGKQVCPSGTFISIRAKWNSPPAGAQPSGWTPWSGEYTSGNSSNIIHLRLPSRTARTFIGSEVRCVANSNASLTGPTLPVLAEVLYVRASRTPVIPDPPPVDR